MGDLSNCSNPGHETGSPKAAHICHSLAIVDDPESGGEADPQRDPKEIHLKGRRSRSNAKKHSEKRLSNVKTKKDIKQIVEMRRVGNAVRDPAIFRDACASEPISIFQQAELRNCFSRSGT
jgi:hypothetical protein